MYDQQGNPIKKFFRVLYGVYSHVEQIDMYMPDGNTKIEEDQWYRARRPDDPPEWNRDIVESSFDLCSLNQPGVTPKFALAGDGTIHPQGAHSNPLHKIPGETGDQYRERMKQLAQECLMAADGQTPTTTPGPQPQAAPPPVDPRAALAKEFEKVSAMKTIEEIRRWAADEEIELKQAKTKEDALKAIKLHLNLA